MTWTVWDILVVVGGALQIAGLIAIGLTVLRIVRGPVAGVAGRGIGVAEKVSGIAGSTLNALNANRQHVASIVADVQAMVSSVRKADGTAGLPINYGMLRNGFATLALARRGMGSLRSLGKRRATAAVPPGPGAKVRAARASLPERLGLLPPALKPVLLFLPYARIALNVLRQIKGR